LLKTRVTELLGLKYPIVQGGMVWNSGWRLASAVSESGGLGLIGAGSMRPEVLREHIQKTKRATEKPFGVNLPLIYGDIEDCLKICVQEEIRIYFTSAGSPKKYTSRLKSEGAKVFHVVSSPELARKCEDSGVDGVVAEGFEAGGHNGREELTTFVLVPQVVRSVKIPVLAAGGVAKGCQILAALALGAEGVQIGSRFAVSEESSAHAGFKNAVSEASPTDTFLHLKKLIPVRLLKNGFAGKIAALEDSGASKEELENLLGKGRARMGMFEGDLSEGELEIGQGVGMINEVLTVSGIYEKLLMEFEEAGRALSASAGHG
jgi:enoyl-[acyl-carrier protein] reductase II